MLKRYYSIDDAAEFLSEEYKRKITAGDILDSAMRAELRLCTFLEWQNISAHNPDGSENHISFNGFIQIPITAIPRRMGIIKFENIYITELISFTGNWFDKILDLQPRDSEGSSHCFEVKMIFGPGEEIVTPFTIPITINIEDALIPTSDILNIGNCKQKTEVVGERSKTTYLNIIGGLLDVMLGESPEDKKNSVFDDQTAIMKALLDGHEGKPGISKRTLEQKFKEAKQSIAST